MTRRAEEFIFEFQKVKHAQKVLEVLIGVPARRNFINENKNSAGSADPDLGLASGLERDVQPMCKNASDHLFTNTEYYQHSWQRGMLTNGDYLLYLNFIAHRSFNDPTQYPVFPWIVQDFKYESLDLSNPMTYRDLGKPIGAHSSDKLEQFKSKYFEIVNKQSGFGQFPAASIIP